jgi:NADH-quinone oxidoreductase subunit N
MPPAEDIVRILPEIILAGTATVLMVMVPLIKNKLTTLYGTVSIVAMLAAIAASLYGAALPGMAFSNLLVVDHYATFFRVLVLAVGVVSVLSSYQFLRRDQVEAGEFHALLLFSLSGQ